MTLERKLVHILFGVVAVYQDSFSSWHKPINVDEATDEIKQLFLDSGWTPPRKPTDPEEVDALLERMYKGGLK